MSITTLRCGRVTRVTTSMGSHVPDRFGNDAATYTCTEDMLADMRKPEYATNPSFRRMVELKVARSGVSTVEDADADSGRFQTVTEEQALQRAEEQARQVGLTPHDAAMLAKYEASQLSGKS